MRTWRQRNGQRGRRKLAIAFVADAPGGPAMIKNALRAIEAGQPFELPADWKIVGVRFAESDRRQKILTLEYVGNDGVESAESKPGPSRLHSQEPLLE